MLLTMTSILKKLSTEEKAMLKEMCEYSNNLYNHVLYHERQKWFNEKKIAGFNENCKVHKINENFKMLNSAIAQQTMKVLDKSFKAFFALLRKKKEGYDKKVRPPYYREKGGLFNLIIPGVHLPKIVDGYFPMKMSKEFKKLHENKKIMIPVPEKLWGRKINQVIIIPLHGGKKFRIDFQYETDLDFKEVDKNKVLAIDVGLDNLATCVTNTGESFIIDGRKIKSINQYWNKRVAKYQGIADKQLIVDRTRFLDNITLKRNNQVKDYMHKAARYIVNYCIEHQIGTIVCGNNKDFKRDINLGKKTNQKFTQIPFGKLRDYLKYKCELHGIDYVEQEESYTSKASFIDLDNIPVYEEGVHHKGEFSGKRTYRGLYSSANGQKINADVNGAANILRKSKQNFNHEELCKGLRISPVRIRLS